MESSSATTTREESRSVVHHSLDALRSEFAVAVTGQPGIGKTRGSMMYALQMLLHRNAAVLYVGYKSDEMLLFLPGDDDKYRVWRTRATKFRDTNLALDPRIVAVIDPPEEGMYSSMGKCRVLKFVSNNAEKHFRNWEKDGILLVTSMPSTEEVVAMTSVLWDIEKTPHPWQQSKLKTLQERISEVEKRIELVGPIPRMVFSSSLFRRGIADCRSSARKAAETLTDLELYKAMRGKYTPFIEKHPMSVSGKLFHLLPQQMYPKSWMERMSIGYEPTLRLSAVAQFELRNRLERSITALRKENFEDFAFDWICATEERLPEIQYDDGHGVTASAFKRICSLRGCELRAYRPVAENFPFIDFATSSTTWFNAKSRKKGSTIKVDVAGAKKFLDELQAHSEKLGLSDCLKGLVKREAPSLVILSNSNVEAKLSTEEDVCLFGEKVKVDERDLSDTGLSAKDCVDRLSNCTRTKQLLDELDRKLGMELGSRARP